MYATPQSDSASLGAAYRAKHAHVANLNGQYVPFLNGLHTTNLHRGNEPEADEQSAAGVDDPLAHQKPVCSLDLMRMKLPAMALQTLSSLSNQLTHSSHTLRLFQVARPNAENHAVYSDMLDR